MSNANKAFSRDASPIANSARRNDRRAHPRSRPRLYRRQTPTEQESLSARTVAISESIPLVYPLLFPEGRVKSAMISAAREAIPAKRARDSQCHLV
jgi:hypothetical protein